MLAGGYPTRRGPRIMLSTVNSNCFAGDCAGVCCASEGFGASRDSTQKTIVMRRDARLEGGLVRPFRDCRPKTIVTGRDSFMFIRFLDQLGLNGKPCSVNDPISARIGQRELPR